MSSSSPPSGQAASSDDLAFIAALRAAIVESLALDALATGEPVAASLEHLVRLAARAIPSPEGALFLVDPVRELLTFEIVIGSTAASVRDLTVPLGHGVAGLVAVSGQAIAVANAQEDPRHARDIAAVSGYFPTTILAVPVLDDDGTPVGVLELLDRQGQPTYSMTDLELLSSFAETIADLLVLRRTTAATALVLGRALTGLTGLPPDTTAVIETRLRDLADRVAADPATVQALDLARLSASIAQGGERELRLCRDVLGAFDTYVQAGPSGAGGYGAIR